MIDREIGLGSMKYKEIIKLKVIEWLFFNCFYKREKELWKLVSYRVKMLGMFDVLSFCYILFCIILEEVRLKLRIFL